MGTLDMGKAFKEKLPKSTSVRMITKDKRNYILLVLERPHNVFLSDGSSFRKDWGWSLPGGRLKRRADGTPRETQSCAIDRELKQEAHYEVGSKRIIAEIADKEKNHNIVIFEGKDPRPCRITQEEPDIADTGWFDPRIVYGSAENPLHVELFSTRLGKKFPVYRRHVNWIQGVFKR